MLGEGSIKEGGDVFSPNLWIKTTQGRMSYARSKIWKDTMTKNNQLILLSTDNTALLQ